MLSDDHHRTVRVAENFVGSRSNLEHLESGDAAVAENNQIHLSRFRSMNNLLRWMTHYDLGLNLHFRFQSARPDLFESFLEVLARVIQHRIHLNASCRLGRAGDSENEKFRIGTMRQIQCDTHGVFRVFRTIVTHENLLKD